MVYEVSELAMKELTLAQVKGLASLDGWRAQKIVVHRDFVCNADSPHGQGWAILAHVWRFERGENRCVITIGIMPDGGMHS